MKKLLFSLFCAAACMPQLVADDVVLTTLLSDGTTNTWTQADLVAALQLLNRKYHRETDPDTGTPSGRAAWHGRLVSTAVDTNTLTKTTTYADGKVFVDHFQRATPKTAHLPPPVMTNGVPARLAAARVRNAAPAVTNEVTVTITPTP